MDASINNPRNLSLLTDPPEDCVVCPVCNGDVEFSDGSVCDCLEGYVTIAEACRFKAEWDAIRYAETHGE